MATITEMANGTKPSPSVNSPATHQRPATNRRDIPAARRVTVVERATELSDEVLEALEAGQRAAIEAAGRFLVTVEEALPQEVQGTSEVAKKITESGLEMADRLVYTQYDFLRKVINSAGKALSGRNGANLSAAK
jgi:oligoribonuclease (3'-5' exoribonuclease)